MFIFLLSLQSLLVSMRFDIWTKKKGGGGVKRGRTHTTTLLKSNNQKKRMLDQTSSPNGNRTPLCQTGSFNTHLPCKEQHESFKPELRRKLNSSGGFYTQLPPPSYYPFPSLFFVSLFPVLCSLHCNFQLLFLNVLRTCKDDKYIYFLCCFMCILTKRSTVPQ